MRRLGSLYDWASKAVHASPYSFALRLSVERDGAARQFNFGYVDFIKRPQEAERDVLSMFMTHISAHLVVAQAFAAALSDVIEKATWDLYFNTAESLFEAHRDRLLPILTPRPRRQSGGFVVTASITAPAPLGLWTPGPPRFGRSR